MKRIITLCFSAFVLLNMFAQNFPLGKTINTTFGDFSFDEVELQDDETIMFLSKNSTGQTELFSTKYELAHINGITCLKLKETIPFNLIKSKYQKLYNQSLIKLSDTIIFLCAQSGNPYFYQNYICYFQGYPNFLSNDFDTEKDFTQIHLKCSSFLTEKDVEYNEKNLCINNVLLPWVEGVPGNGIGEYIEIETVNSFKFDYLLIMNGFLSVEKPYLYKQNNRIKTIKVTGLNSGKEKILDVLDTPHPQTVDISYLELNEPFRIIIMDIYKGTKYDDTCINCLTPWYEPVVPYENFIGD